MARIPDLFVKLVHVTMFQFAWVAPVLAQTPAQQLQEALSLAGPGQIVKLAPGDYGGLVLHGLEFPPGRPLTVLSADPARPARFRSLTLREVRGIVLENLVFDYAFQAGDESYKRPFIVERSRDVTLSGNRFEGDLARDVGPASDGFPTGFGLGIRWSQDVIIENNVIRGFLRGLLASESSDLIVRGNDLFSLRSDGMNFAEVADVLIEANHIHDFHGSAASGDHRDMIQFWTTGTRAPSRNITIRDNLLSSGRGSWSQSIFMRNELVDTGAAGNDFFYRNVTIENNFILNAHVHGIAVGETQGLRIANNTLLHNPLSDGPEDNPALWRPQIRVSPQARNVEIVRNVAAGLIGTDGQAGWKLADNLIVQDYGRMKPGFYGTVFTSAALRDRSRPSAYMPRAGGPLDGTGIGATLTAQGSE